MSRARLSVSIVLFEPDVAVLASTLQTLDVALRHAMRSARLASCPRLFVIANSALSPAVRDLWRDAAKFSFRVELIEGQGNVGYGRGHNLALAAASSAEPGIPDERDYFLVLNPDVELEPQTLEHAIAYLDTQADAVLAVPRVMNERGEQQFLCRRYPSLVDLFVRGFLPLRLRRHFDARLARYELRDVTREADRTQQPFAPQIVSGCFMLYRSAALRRLDGFDPRYFLYFEDYDLSLRTADVGRIAYLPWVCIVHRGGGAARKGRRHVAMFVASAARFFHRFGWRVF